MNYQTMRYTYDRLGNRTSKRDVLAEQAGADLDEIYTYDQQNQLIDLDRVGNHEHFHYDTTGNWLAYQQNGTLQTRTHNAANEIVSVDGSDTSLHTDAAGNMTRIPNPKAVPGQTVAQNLNLTYDAWNRLVRVSTPDGSEVISCSYDGLNRRVRKTTASETREYYYNKNWQCLEEYLYGTLQNSYLWGLRYLDDLICFTPDYTIALTDANFNVVAVANQSGLTERYTYTAFGQRTILTPSYAPRSESMYPALTRTFTSQILDHETGVMLYRNRYYQPSLGCFITRDLHGRWNEKCTYKYCNNNSVHAVDPSGNEGGYATTLTKRSLGLYSGFGFECTISLDYKTKPCCTENGKLLTNGLYESLIDITIQYGIGLGAKFEFMGFNIDLLWQGPQLFAKFPFEAKNNTCGQLDVCKKICLALGVNLGNAITGGFGIGFKGSIDVSGEIQVCVNLGPRCTQNHIAIGFCGKIDGSITFFVPWYRYTLSLSDAFPNSLGTKCIAIVGNDSMLKK